MRQIEVKPEHVGELRYLLDEAEHLRKMGKPPAEQAAAIRRLGRRQLALYPEVNGRDTGFDEVDGRLFITIYDNQAEYFKAIKDVARKEKRAPYVGFMGAPGNPVLGAE